MSGSENSGAIGAFVAETPSVGIFWLVTVSGKSRLITVAVPLDHAEPYGDFLTFADGHYTVWERWRRAGRDADAGLLRLVRSFEYEDSPRRRVVFDRVGDRFILYADRKLMAADTIAYIARRFLLPTDRTDVQTDFHYQSRETPDALE